MVVAGNVVCKSYSSSIRGRNGHMARAVVSASSPCRVSRRTARVAAVRCGSREGDSMDSGINPSDRWVDRLAFTGNGRQESLKFGLGVAAPFSMAIPLVCMGGNGGGNNHNSDGGDGEGDGSGAQEEIGRAHV